MTEALLNAINWADYVIIAIIIVSTLVSIIRGFIREVLSLATWVVAFIVAFSFCDKLADAFIAYTENSSLRFAIAFAILFLVTLILGGLIAHLISILISKARLNLADRSLGMIFGFMRGIIVIGVLLLLVQMVMPERPAWCKESYFVPHFQKLVDYLHGFFPIDNNNLEEQVDAVIAPESES